MNVFSQMYYDDKFEKCLGKMLKIKSKYDVKVDTYIVDKNIKIKFNLASLHVLINDVPLIKYEHDLTRKLARSFISGATLGVVKMPVIILTDDKNIVNKENLLDISNKISRKVASGEFEQYICSLSKNKWGMSK